MFAAMFVGMIALGGLLSLVLRLFGHGNVYEHADLRELIMSVNMTVGMSVWMRYRGHNWLHTSEMAAAMFIPLAVLIYPFWAGLLSSRALAAGTHVLMLPAMLGIMLFRWNVYSQDHRLGQHPQSHT